MKPLGEGSLIVVTGAGGPAGRATVQSLIATGANVVGADVDEQRLDSVARSLGSGASRFSGQVVDLLDPARVSSWADAVAAGHPRGGGGVDGVVHLVGGWRGGAGFTDNTVEDAAWLHDMLVRTLQHVSLAFHDHLLVSPRGQFVIVSAIGAARPTAGNAAYAASKSAAEAWNSALADSFATRQIKSEATAAATTLVVKALVDDGMRAAQPERNFSGFVDVRTLAAEVAALWNLTATQANGQRVVVGA